MTCESSGAPPQKGGFGCRQLPGAPRSLEEKPSQTKSNKIKKNQKKIKPNKIKPNQSISSVLQILKRSSGSDEREILAAFTRAIVSPLPHAKHDPLMDAIGQSLNPKP
jgi:hypothetical protein